MYYIYVGTVEERPTIRELLGVMRIKNSGITANWFDLGLELLNDYNIVQNIATDHRNDIHSCCRTMFGEWLERIPDASWNHLVAALDKIGIKYAANVVSEQFIPGN